VDLVREVIDLLNQDAGTQRHRELLERFSPEVRIDMTRRVFNPDVYSGHEGLKRLGSEVQEVWKDFRIEAERIVDAGDRVVVIENRRGRGIGSDVEVEQRAAVIWTLQHGRVIAMETDLDPQEALKAVGLAG